MIRFVDLIREYRVPRDVAKALANFRRSQRASAAAVEAQLRTLPPERRAAARSIMLRKAEVARWRNYKASAVVQQVLARGWHGPWGALATASFEEQHRQRALTAEVVAELPPVVRKPPPPPAPITVREICEHFNVDPTPYLTMSADQVRWALCSLRAREDEAAAISPFRSERTDDKPDASLAPYAHKLSRLPLSETMKRAAAAVTAALWQRAGGEDAAQ